MNRLFHPYNYRPETTGRPARKVVNIPVTFVGGNRRRTELDSAVRIQSAFRGHLVRRTFRKIATVRTEVLEVERYVREEGEALELLRREEKERVRVNERLMGLLLRLDGVPGVDHGIRELRREVIRKAIALQDAVDAIGEKTAEVAVEVSQEDSSAEADGCGGDDVAVEASQEDSSAEATRIDEIVETYADVEGEDRRDRNHEETADSDGCCGYDVVVQVRHEDSSAEAIKLDETDADVEDEDLRDRSHEETAEADGYGVDDTAVEASQEESPADQLRQATSPDDTVTAVASTPSPDLEDNADEEMSESNGCCGDDAAVEASQDDSPAEHPRQATALNETFDAVSSSACPDSEDTADGETAEDEEEGGDGCGSDDVAVAEREKKEAVDRMREDNERMMGMMAELLERNGEQMRLLTSLSQRVEMLERAFLWDRLRRKMNTKNCKAKKDVGGDISRSKDYNW